MNDALGRTIRTLAARLREAKRVTVLTGAGVSAASGVPTFRGEEGLWRNFRPEDLATPDAFRRDPHTAWEWYAWRRERIAACAPNDAHRVIAAWSSRPGYHVLTQNVDDLHLRAGTAGLVRLHGSIWELACLAPCRAGAAAWPDTQVPLPELPPRCPHCGGIARPAVVLFGETLRERDLAAAARAAACDVFIAAGTSAVVYPAAGFLHQARAHGALTVEINPASTAASSVVDVVVPLPAEQAFAAIERELGA